MCRLILLSYTAWLTYTHVTFKQLQLSHELGAREGPWAKAETNRSRNDEELGGSELLEVNRVFVKKLAARAGRAAECLLVRI